MLWKKLFGRTGYNSPQLYLIHISISETLCSNYPTSEGGEQPNRCVLHLIGFKHEIQKN